MKKIHFLKFVLFALSAIFIYACTEDEATNPVEEPQNFDRGAMLVHWADKIIVPAITDFATQTAVLKEATQTFVNTPTEGSLENLQLAWYESYLSFQRVSMFEIGKAEELNYRARLNAYPTSVLKITDFVENGNYNLTLPSTYDAQGFPALDYMLYGLGATSQETLSFYTNHENAEAYKNYLLTLSQTIHQLSDEVKASWTGSYRDIFVENTASSASGSVDKFTNDFIFYYEKALRAAKVGIPAGVFSNDPLPQNVEGFYRKDISKALLLEALQASQDFFNGNEFNNNSQGPSFKSYLEALNTVKNGEDLGVLINEQFIAAQNAALLLNDNFVEQVQTDNDKMLETYNQLQRNVVLLKVDMLQALSIDVDYVDADGD